MKTPSPEQFCSQLRIHNKTLADKIEKQGYFISDEDLPKLEQYDRFTQVLVRCGNGRFICAVQDVAHFIKIIEEHSELYEKVHGEPFGPTTDHIRDLSLPI